MHHPTLTRSFTAAGDITKRRIVKVGAGDGEALQAAASGDSLIGVSAEVDVKAHGRVDAHLQGIAALEYGGNVTRGDALTADADGKAVPAAHHTHTENTAAAYARNATTGAASSVRIVGVALVAGVAGDIGYALLGPGLA